MLKDEIMFVQTLPRDSGQPSSNSSFQTTTTKQKRNAMHAETLASCGPTNPSLSLLRVPADLPLFFALTSPKKSRRLPLQVLGARLAVPDRGGLSPARFTKGLFLVFFFSLPLSAAVDREKDLSLRGLVFLGLAVPLIHARGLVLYVPFGFGLDRCLQLRLPFL